MGMETDEQTKRVTTNSRREQAVDSAARKMLVAASAGVTESESENEKWVANEQEKDRDGIADPYRECAHERENDRWIVDATVIDGAIAIDEQIVNASLIAPPIGHLHRPDRWNGIVDDEMGDDFATFPSTRRYFPDNDWMGPNDLNHSCRNAKRLDGSVSSLTPR